MTTSSTSVENQWRNFRDCPKCQAPKGTACRTPSCEQLKECPKNIRDNHELISEWRHTLMMASMKSTFCLSRDELIVLMKLGPEVLNGLSL